MKARFLRGARGLRYLLRRGRRIRMRSGIPDAHILLEGNEVAEDAADGTVIGALSVAHSDETYTFSLTDDADGQFAVDGTNLVVATDAVLVAGAHTVTIQAQDEDENTVTKDWRIVVTEAE